MMTNDQYRGTKEKLRIQAWGACQFYVWHPQPTRKFCGKDFSANVANDFCALLAWR